MAGLIQELRDSRTFTVNENGGEATFRYVLTGEPDEAVAYDIVQANSPATWYGYTRSTIDLTNRPSLDVWFPVVNYTIPVFEPGAVPPMGDGPGGDTPPSGGGAAPSDGDLLTGVSVSINLENQNVKRSLQTISKTGFGGDPPDCSGLINVTKDKVEGVDIGIPIATIQVKSTLPYLTAGYFKNLLWVCGKTNLYDWWLFKQEEALFTGANGSSKGSGEFEINYEFKYQRTRQNITIRSDGDGLVVPIKRGWHYLWTMTRKEKDTGANALIERPYAAYVEQVYDAVNFEWLGSIR